MTVEFATIGNSLVARSVEYPWRWYDAWGTNVIKYLQDFVGYPVDNTTFLPTDFVTTLVNASTAVPTDVLGGAMLITAAGADNDGVKLQLGSTAGENVWFGSRYPTYFRCTLQINDVDQTDFLAGFFVTDTTALDGGTDGLYFRSVDETGVVNFVLEQGSVETVTAVNTMTDAADVTLEFTYSADGNVRVYVNTVLMATIADTDANFCNDQLLRLTFEFLTGEAIANTCLLKNLSFIQIQD